MKESGKIKSIRKDGKSVCISNGYGDIWYDFSERVIPYIGKLKIGETVNFDAEEVEGQNPVINFIQAEYKEHIEKKVSNVLDRVKNEVKSEAENLGMTRMSALKAAGQIFQGAGKEQLPEFWKLVEDIIIFIGTGKQPVEGKIPIEVVKIK